MNILLTGGSGFLGSRFLQQIQNKPYQLFILGRSKKLQVHLPNIHYFSADLTDKNSLKVLKKLLPDIDTIIHLAARVPKNTIEDIAASMYESNIMGTIQLLEVFGNSVKHIIYGSSVEVYGLPNEVKEPITEMHIPDPQTYYAASKLGAEYYSISFAHKHHIPTTILRFSVMYGPGDLINRAIPNFITSALHNKPIELFGGEEKRDYLHVDDAVSAINSAIVHPQNGIFNIASGTAITVKRAAEYIRDQININLEITVLPRTKNAADIVLSIAKAKQLLLYEPHYVFPEKLEEEITWIKNR